MSGGFGNVLLGGEIDSVGQVRRLPHPIFPKFTVPKIKGLYIDVPPVVGTYSAVIVADKDIEFINASLACSGYLHPDYWELQIGNYKLMETIYTKELPQTVYGGTLGVLVYPVKADTPIRVDFVNNSATSKQVWFDLKFLLSPDDYDTINLDVTLI